MADKKPWTLKGELMLSCNCTVFCPCVLSLGKHPPTEGYCQTWGGVRIDEGNYDGIDLSGINMGLMIDIPGMMSRGKWAVGLYIGDNANDDQVDALSKIMSGQAGGPPRVLSILVGEFLGVWQEPITYEVENGVRKFKMARIIDGEIHPVAADQPDKHTVIENSQYWIGPKIIIAQAQKSRFRALGRNWDFEGRSAEIVPLDWVGP